VRKKDIKILKKRKQRLQKRLERRQWSEQSKPMFRAQNIRYEMADRVRAIDSGGIGAFHMLARNSGLIEAINRKDIASEATSAVSRIGSRFEYCVQYPGRRQLFG
jgi:hypothetical protein